MSIDSTPIAVAAIERYERECPWERQEGEPITAYGFFNTYLELGPGRAVSRAYGLALASERGSEHTWRRYYVLYDWKSRAEAWDEYGIACDRAMFEIERKEWRKKRQEILSDVYKLIPTAIGELKRRLEEDAKNMSHAQLIEILDIVFSQTREEFRDKSPSTAINVDQRTQRVEIRTIEVTKDYGRKIIDG